MKMIRLNSILAGLIMLFGIEEAADYGYGIAILYLIWSMCGVLFSLWFFWQNSLTGILVSQTVLILSGLLIFPFDSYYLISSFLPFDLAVWFSVLYSQHTENSDEESRIEKQM